MLRLDAQWCCAALAAALLSALPAQAAEELAHRYSAPIEIRRPAPFVQIELPPAAYARAQQSDLRDLRVVDARGERVPFALLSPPAAPPASDRERATTLYPLPPRPAPGAAWPSPVDVVVEGERISVHRRAAPFPAKATLAAGGAPGWLIDLGQARAGEPVPRQLRVSWSGPAEFSASYSLETSADLRSWRSAGAGQLMALQSATGALTQPLVALPYPPGRFVRLVWFDPAAAPAVSSATALAADRDTARNATSELVFKPITDPSRPAATDAEARRALEFDLGGALPIVDVQLRFSAGTRVAPVRVQGRARADAPWHELGSGVFYRLERAGDVAESPPVALRASVRFLRFVPDERSAALDPVTSHLVVNAPLAGLVFALDGAAPFRLLAGSVDAAAGALPIATLVPRLDDERGRFGDAVLGEFAEIDAVARAAEQAQSRARLRPYLLWGVLLVGVAALAALVWRLAKAGPATQPPDA